MLLTADAGNTNITFGVYDEEKVIAGFRLTTKMARTSDEFGNAVCGLLKSKGVEKEMITDIVLCSVVPNINHSLCNCFKKYFGIEPMIISCALKTAITVKTDNPKASGADRIVDNEAAYCIYGGPVIVCDFGTATTYDYVDENGIFRYCVTAPGIGISAKALTGMAAQLPDIEIAMPDSILGTNTVSSMQAGIVYGYIGSVEKIITEMKKQLNVDCKVVATGGLGRVIYPYTDVIDVYDPDLTINGMRLIYEKNK